MERLTTLTLDELYSRGFVEKYYQMDPRTEDVLYDCTELKNGMIVLIESYEVRRSLEDLKSFTDHEIEMTYRFNRWFQISHLFIDLNTVSFLATYDDGSKKKHRVGIHEGWVVKRDSMPVPASKLENKLDEPIVVPFLHPAEVKGDVLSQTSYSPLSPRRIGVVEQPQRQQTNRFLNPLPVWQEDQKSLGVPGGEETGASANPARPLYQSVRSTVPAVGVAQTPQDSGTIPRVAPDNAQLGTDDPTWYENMKAKWENEKGTKLP